MRNEHIINMARDHAALEYDYWTHTANPHIEPASFTKLRAVLPGYYHEVEVTRDGSRYFYHHELDTVEVRPILVKAKGDDHG